VIQVGKMILIAIVLVMVFSIPVYADCTSSRDYSSMKADCDGVTSLVVYAPEYYNGTDWTDINTTIGENPASQPLYDYGIEEGIYQIFFKEDPDDADSIMFVRNETYLEPYADKYAEFSFQPYTLKYVNDLSQIQQISIVQSVIGYPTENFFVYPAIYGDGINMTYEYDAIRLAKNLVIKNVSVLTEPESYMVDGGNLTVALDFQINVPSGTDVYINDALWDKSSTVSTSGKVDFVIDGVTIYSMPVPYAYDSDGMSILLEYEFKKQGSKYYITVFTPYDWLNSSLTYPVYIDPTLEVAGGSTSIGGNVYYDVVNVRDSGTINVNSTGWLNLSAGIIIIDSTSSINANNLGGAGGIGRVFTDAQDGYQGSGTGGGCGGDYSGWIKGAGSGGGYGGTGGAGGGGTPCAGSSYGTSTTYNVQSGSGGGGGLGNYDTGFGNYGTGGTGGGFVVLNASYIRLYGSVYANGQVGYNYGAQSGGGGGGGSAGGIVLIGNDIDLTGSLYANGGNGGNGNNDVGAGASGGGGGGGRIKVYYNNTFTNSTSTVQANGGSAGSGCSGGSYGCPTGSAGSSGTIYYSQQDIGLPYQDVTVSGTTIELGGDLTIGSFSVESSSTINIDSDYGYLNITADSIIIESGSSIVGTGKGYSGGSGCGSFCTGIQGSSYAGSPTQSVSANYGGGGGGGVTEPITAPSGGGGGAYGNNAGHGGSRGNFGYGGALYGTINGFNIAIGSGGGGGGANANPSGVGADGGGLVVLNSSAINISGSIVTSGNVGGGSIAGAGGGGSGGGIMLFGQHVNLNSATLTASGGNGGAGSNAGGGGGSGGRIKVFYQDSFTNTSSTVSVSNGAGGSGYVNGGAGGVGTIYYNQSALGFGEVSNAPDVYFIESISAQDPTEGTVNTITFNVSVLDADGYGDISLVNASFNNSGTSRVDINCTAGSSINASAINYSCSIDMNYYDDAGTWSIEIYAEDSFSDSDTMWSSFTYNTLTAWNMTPTSVMFPSGNQSATNIIAYNHTVMENTGNVNLTTIEVNATNLVGVASANIWNAGNFSMNIASACEGTQMVTDTYTTVSGSVLPYGSGSKEDLYYCIESIPVILPDIYNTNTNGEWTIRSVS